MNNNAITTNSIYIIAGEPSGDALGGKLIHALKAKLGDVTLHGVGGQRMEEAGLQSLFPMSELSIMGFVELIPHIPHLLKRIDQTVADILEKRPNVVVTIDSPGFTFRVAKKLQDAGIPLVHYVAPTVWAYKPERAAKIAKLFDHLMVLLPFEPPYFEKEGLQTTFTGHPIVEEKILHGRKDRLMGAYGIARDARIITVLAGSRKTETKKLLPVYQETIELLAKQYDNLHIMLPTVPALEEELKVFAENLPVPATVTISVQDKLDAYAASEVALAKSGTATLELALAHVPMVITYKVNRFSAWMLRRMIKVKYVNLINILQDREVIPERLQEQCKPEVLAEEIGTLLDDEHKRRAQVSACEESLRQLGLGAKPSPSEKAAEVVMGYLGSRG